MQARCIQSSLSSAFFALFRNDAGGMRFVAQRDCKHFWRGRHFEIEREIGCFLNASQVLITDVATILAQVRGDPVPANASNDLCRAHRIGMVAPARVTDRCNVIDIHSEAEAVAHAFRLPGLVTSMAASSGGSSSSLYVGKSKAASG